MNERGYALLVLLLGLAVGGAGLLASVPALSGPSDSRRPKRLATERVQRVADAAALACRFGGSFPPSLDAVQPWLRGGTTDPWRHDPMLGDADLGYRIRGAPPVLSVWSVGFDRRSGTRDDVVATAHVGDLRLATTRDRLRTLRALFVRNWILPHGLRRADRAALLANTSTWARSQRLLRDATAAEMRVLVRDRDAAASRIARLFTRYSIPAVPANATGPRGLASALGLEDSVCIDGFGHVLSAHATVGFLSLGGDGTGGTIDDL